MNKFIDYYKVLQVHNDAAQDVIDAAYRCLCKLYHPDINKSVLAEERMKAINVAYSIVGDSQKRRAYHPEWIRNNVGKAAVLRAASYREADASKDAEQERAAQRSRDIRKEKEAQREAEALKEQALIDEAYKALDGFFSATVKENWEAAYSKLTNLDKERISLSDFVEWKKSVTQVYKLGNYTITYFKKQEQCLYGETQFPQAIQFTVELTELQIFASQIHKEVIQKYVALEEGCWRICLGFADLKSSTKKFKHLAHALPKVDEKKIFLKAVTKIDPLTGLLSHSGFLEQAETEMLRSQRYGNPLALGVVTVLPDENTKEESWQEQTDSCVSYAGQILAENLRKTDIIGRCGPASFGILFTETTEEDGEKALNKLTELARGDEYISYQLASAVTRLFKGEAQEIITATLDKVAVKETIIEDAPTVIPLKNNKNSKLGKYRISDLMGFNIKGRNHF